MSVSFTTLLPRRASLPNFLALATLLFAAPLAVAAESAAVRSGAIRPHVMHSGRSSDAPSTDANRASITLDAAVRLAVDRAPLLDARRSQVVSAEQEARRAGALPDPTLSVGIDNLPVTGPDAFNTGADFMTMKKIGLRQAIPARAKREAQRTLAARGIDEANARAQAEQLDVRRRTAQAWIDLWSTARELEALEALRDEATLASTLARARVRGGAGTVDDALSAAAAVVELDVRMDALSADVAAAQARLARWTGDDAAAVDTKLVPDFSALPVPEARLVASIDRLGPVLPVSAQVETAAAAVDAARAEKHPDWSVAMSYGQRERGRSDMLMLEFGIGLPLFPGERQDRGIAAREADYAATLAERDDLRRDQLAMVRSRIATWEGLKRQVDREGSEWLPLARDRSSVALAAFRNGAEVRPWLDARRDELAVVVAHARRTGELARAWADLAYLLPTESQP